MDDDYNPLKASYATRVACGQVVASSANGLAWVVSAWGMFYPRPRGLVMVLLIGFPLVVLALLGIFRGILSLEDPSDKPRQMVLALGLPTLALTICTFGIHLGGALMWTLSLVVTVGAALSGACLLLDPTARHSWALGGVVLCGLFYGYGATVGLNSLLDHSIVRNESATVVRVDAEVGKGVSSVNLSAWGSYEHGESFVVSRALARRVKVGDKVHVRVRAGALGIPWFTIHAARR